MKNLVYSFVIVSVVLLALFTIGQLSTAQNKSEANSESDDQTRVPKTNLAQIETGAPLVSAPMVTTFVVTKSADTNDGVCNADCSLREAVAAANALSGADIITFNMGVGAGFVQSPINLTLGEIVITGDLTINGPG